MLSNEPRPNYCWMGCQSSRSALVNATTARLEAAKQDDISIEGDELPVSVSVCHPCSQLYLSLVPTDAPQRNEITSLLGLLKSSGALGEIEDAIASVGACYSTVSTLSDQISEALVRDVRTFQPGGCGLQVDLIKAYSIFVWVSTNIEYDCKAWEDLLKDLPTPSINPENVLSTKRSICSGYAALYSALASEVGLESLVIDGHFKISRALQSNGPLAEFAPSHLNTHAWNRVCIICLKFCQYMYNHYCYCPCFISATSFTCQLWYSFISPKIGETRGHVALTRLYLCCWANYSIWF